MVRNAQRSLAGFLGGAALILTQTLTSGVSVGSQSGDVNCELTPLELPLFGGTPVTVFATPTEVASETLEGDVDQAEIETALEQYVACVNTGDPTLVWAVFTPRWFAQSFANPEEHYLPAFEQMLDGPLLPPENPIQLVRIDEVSQLDDGRVDVTATFSSADQQWTDLLTLAPANGTWLIDDVHLVESAG